MSVFPDSIQRDTTARIRFGLGVGGPAGPTTPEAMLARLGQPDAMLARHPKVGFDEAVAATAEMRAATRDVRAGVEGAADTRRRWARWLNDAAVRGFASDLARMLDAEDAFRERLAWFWADHFTVRFPNSNLRPATGAYLDEVIRPGLTGRFADLLKAAVIHPAMLIYLDQVTSFGPNSRLGLRRGRGLNENLAREVLELHTLGVDAAYSQTDVRELAELFTGLTFTLNEGFRFRRSRAEPGAETVLGRSYGGDGPARLRDIHAALDDLARHPATATHIARKLAVHFVADAPDPDLVAQMAQAFQAHDGDLMRVYAAMLDHPAAWQGFGAKIKQPLDYMASTLRVLGVDGAAVRGMEIRQLRTRLMRPLTRMGQPFQSAPGPDGWPEDAAAWITPQGLAERLDFAMRAVRRPHGAPTDPMAFARAALADAAGAKLLWAVGAAETRREAAALVLASAEFNRR